MDSNELRKKLLENSDQVLDKVLYLLSGKDDAVLNPWEREAIDVLYPTLHQIIINANDLKKIDAESTKDITRALSQGKITAQEAIQLMSMLQMKFDIDDANNLMQQLMALKSGGTIGIGRD